VGTKKVGTKKVGTKKVGNKRFNSRCKLLKRLTFQNAQSFICPVEHFGTTVSLNCDIKDLNFLTDMLNKGNHSNNHLQGI